VSSTEVHGPSLPPKRQVDLPGRGTTHVTEVAGPPGAPTLLLLHGWTATADLNWFPAYSALGAHFRVLAPDQRGHGRGIRPRGRFRLADCADDAAALADAFGVEAIIPVGYSMGGLVAQLLWHRHRDRVAGLVLCATARNFRGSRAEAGWFNALGAAAVASRLVPHPVRRRVGRRVVEQRSGNGQFSGWATEEFSRGDPRLVLEAGNAIGRFTSHEWITGVDVPTAVVLTQNDRVVPPPRQRRLADAIPGATIHPAPIDHGGCVVEADRFVPVLVGACREVAARAQHQPQPSSVNTSHMS
jgi:pimeloyl-ACP methyl ester carboxylesterase